MVNQLRQMWRLLGGWAVGLFLLTGMIFLFASPVEAGIGAITEYNLNSSSWPNYMVAGPDGNLWVTDCEPAIDKVNPTTGEITKYSTGLNSGSAPNYIVAGPDGNLWFTDNGSIKAIGKIDRATGAITEYSTGLTGSDLNIIVAGPDGNLWFTDNGSTRAIGRIDPATGGITKYTTGLNSGSILTVIVAGPDGNLWFTEGGTTPAIGKVNPATGEINEYTTGLNGSSLPNYIVAGPDGNLWFTDNGSTKAIGRIDPSTGTITEYTTGSGSGNLYNIVAGPDGNLWSGDYDTSTIYRVNPSTGSVTAYPIGAFSFLPNYFLASGPDGNLWFTDSCTPAIGKVYAVVPAVTAVSPAGGPATSGTTVTITGSGFTGATAVSFGGVAASSFAVNSATSITAISPVHEAGTVDVTVTTRGGASAAGSADQFTYTSSPITTGTISGTAKDGNNNPISGATVSLTVSGSVYSTQTAANGAYSILNVPAGTGYTVTASKAGFQDRTASGVTVTAGSTTAGVDFILYTAVEDSSISPTSATFDKNSANTGAGHYADIPVTITFNGNTLLSIMNGSVPLVENTDYTVSGSVYSISKTYLAGQSLGTTTLTLNFNAGSPQSLTVTIGDSTPTTHTVSVSANPPAGGSVSGGGTYEEGASVIVTATPNSGYSFVNWTEGGVQVSTGVSYTFMLGTSGRTLVANFAANPTYTVTFDSKGDSPVASINNVSSGSTISAPTAPTRSGYTFGGWYKESSCTNAWNFSTDTVTGNITLYAKWTASQPATHTVSVSANPSAGGSVGGGGTYNEGASVTVTASVYSGYNFINWTENNAQVSANLAYTFIMGTVDRSLTANFATVTAAVYSVSVSANPAAGGTVTGGGTYAQGATMTVTAAPNSGYSFVNWTEGGTPVSNSASYTFTMVASDRTLTANFSTTIPPSGGGSTPLLQPVNSTNGTATVAPAAGGAVGLGSDVTLKIPANALQGSNSVQVAVQKVDTPPPAPSGFMAMGSAYRFTVNGQDHYHFNQPVTLTFTFDPSRLAPGETPAVYYYDETKGQWVNIGGTVSGNTITVTVDHFTKYAVLVEQSGSPAQIPAITLSDIAGHWAEANINKLVAKRAISGYPDGTFKPDNTITRAEFVTVLVKALKLTPKAGPVFADTQGIWAQGYISTAAADGVVGGYNGNTFGPDDPVTREQMAVMTIKTAKLSLASGDLDFTDSGKISPWARDAVLTAVKGGIMKGYPDNTFRPNGNATRAEAVTVIVNAINLQ